MDLEARIKEIQARIDALRKIIEESEIDNNRPEPEATIEETKVHEEQPKPKPSAADDLKAKLMKKK
jgi:hypothetical protein